MGQKFLTWVRLGQFFEARVGSGFGKFPLKTSNFLIFFCLDQKKSLWVRSESTWVKGGSVSYLLRVISKFRSGQVRAHLYARHIHPKGKSGTLLFLAGLLWYSWLMTDNAQNVARQRAKRAASLEISKASGF